MTEVGQWVKEYSREGDIMFGTSTYEWSYYTNRHTTFELRIYFLPEERIDYYLKLIGIKYVLVRYNQIIADSEWNHVEYYPESFYQHVKALYPLVYQSSYQDIEVYEVTPA